MPRSQLLDVALAWHDIQHADHERAKTDHEERACPRPCPRDPGGGQADDEQHADYIQRQRESARQRANASGDCPE